MGVRGISRTRVPDAPRRHCTALARPYRPSTNTLLDLFSHLYIVINLPSWNSSLEVGDSITNESDHFPAICIVKMDFLLMSQYFFSTVHWRYLNSWLGGKKTQIEDACHEGLLVVIGEFFKKPKSMFNNQLNKSYMETLHAFSHSYTLADFTGVNVFYLTNNLTLKYGSFR